MSKRAELEAIATQWVSLWTVPVDWGLFERLHAPAFEDCSPAGRPATKEGFGQGLAELTRVLPDLRTAIEDLVVDAKRSRVAIRWSALGTNRKSFLGAGPTHRATPITGIEVIEIQAAQIVRRWGEWDISAHHAGL